MSQRRTPFKNGMPFDPDNLHREYATAALSGDYTLPQATNRREQQRLLFLAEQQSIFEENQRLRDKLSSSLNKHHVLPTTPAITHQSRPGIHAMSPTIDSDVSMMSISPVNSPQSSDRRGGGDDSLQDVDMPFQPGPSTPSTPSRTYGMNSFAASLAEQKITSTGGQKLEDDSDVIDLTLVKNEHDENVRRFLAKKAKKQDDTTELLQRLKHVNVAPIEPKMHSQPNPRRRIENIYESPFSRLMNVPSEAPSKERVKNNNFSDFDNNRINSYKKLLPSSESKIKRDKTNDLNTANQNLDQSTVTSKEDEKAPTSINSISSSKQLLTLALLSALFSISIGVLYRRGYIDLAMFRIGHAQTFLSDQELVQRLQSLVIGQSAAISRIQQCLSCDQHQNKVVLFVGSPGVGKTFTTTIISNNRRSRTLVAGQSTLLGDDAQDHLDKATTAPLCEQFTSWLNPPNIVYDTFVFEEVHAVSEQYRRNLAESLVKHLANKTHKYNQLVILVSLDTSQRLTKNLYKRYQKTKDFTNREDGADIFDPKTNSFSHLIGVELSNLVTHTVPFLPLQLPQIEECIRRELRLRNIPITNTNIGKIVAQLHFFPSDNPIFCASGCRKISTLIDIIFK